MAKTSKLTAKSSAARGASLRAELGLLTVDVLERVALVTVPGYSGSRTDISRQMTKVRVCGSN